jgi:protein-disulfide isomerase
MPDKPAPRADDAPINALPAAEHSQGDAHAPLTLVEYGDYECPACRQAEPLVRHLRETCGAQMRFVFRHFPLVEVHPHAELAAEAAEAAAAQGRFWPMHHQLFAHSPHLAASALSACAQAVGLDMIRFHAEMADRIYTQRVQEHRRAAQALGLRGTPGFFLNGRAIDVSFGFDHLETAVLALLAKH